MIMMRDFLNLRSCHCKRGDMANEFQENKNMKNQKARIKEKSRSRVSQKMGIANQCAIKNSIFFDINWLSYYENDCNNLIIPLPLH